MSRQVTRTGFFAPSRPRAVEGGLKARSKRGAIAQTWWSGRFIAVLEEIGVGGRLERGRSYARKGQVIALDVDAGSVTATVQGSRSRPYRVRVGLSTFGKAEWAGVERELAASAWYLAKLLDGEMPDDIEEVFAAAGLSLFPVGAGDLSMDCSCPDHEVPCKHLAATLYLLAERFDDDPFEILAWRGREREDLLSRLEAARDESRGEAGHTIALEDCLDSYFALRGALPLRPLGHGRRDALLAQLTGVDVTVRGVDLVTLLRPMYAEG